MESQGLNKATEVTKGWRGQQVWWRGKSEAQLNQLENLGIERGVDGRACLVDGVTNG